MNQNLDDKLLEKVDDNRYVLVNFAAMRARQINDGVVTYAGKDGVQHPLDIALEEIKLGKITVEIDIPVVQEEEERDLEMFALDEMSDFDLISETDDFEIEPLDLSISIDSDDSSDDDDDDDSDDDDEEADEEEDEEEEDDDDDDNDDDDDDEEE